MERGMHDPHLIPDVLTKWHTQIRHILTVIPFLSSTISQF
jgi:hypothetical protein